MVGIEGEVATMASEVEKMEFRRMFNNPADPLNAFLDIQAGAGGTEACDWASMLLRQYLRYAERKGFKAQIEALSTRQESGTTLERIHKPALILGGNQDNLCPPEIQATMHQMIEGSELVMLDDCGHFSMLEKPQDVNDALRNWYLKD